MTQLTISIDKHDQFQILKLTGRLDLRSIHEHSLAIKDFPLEHTIIDCQGIEFIDSSGLGMITSLLQRLRNHDKGLVLMNISDTLSLILNRTHLDTIFSIADTLESATTHFQS
jgi:anti-sigma B factor antagonist